MGVWMMLRAWSFLLGKIGLVQMIRPGAPAVLSHITMHTGMGHFYFFLQARKTRFIKELTTLAVCVYQMTPHHSDSTDAICPASQGAHVCQGAHDGILGARHRVDTGKIATVKVQMPSQVNVVVAPGRDWKQHLSTFYEDQRRPPAAQD